MNSGQPLVIPSGLLERAERLAQQQARQVREVVAEALELGLPLLETADTTPELEREAESFRQMHPTWREQYVGEYVAVYQGRLVDHDPVFETLLERIDEKFPTEFVLIRPLLDEPEIVYDHRSIRWVTAD